MALVQRDFILRMIEAIAAALARALRRREQGDLQGARDEIAGATRELLGTTGSLVAYADAQTAYDLLSDARRVVLWVRLLLEDAGVLHAMGRPADAIAVRRRAWQLVTEIQRRAPELSDDDKDFVARVAANQGESLQPEA